MNIMGTMFKSSLIFPVLILVAFIGQQEPSEKEMQKLEEKWFTVKSWSASYNEDYHTEKTWELRPGVTIKTTVKSTISGTYTLDVTEPDGQSFGDWYGYGNGSSLMDQTVITESEGPDGTITITEKTHIASSGAIGIPSKNEYGEFWGGGLSIDIYNGTYSFGFGGPEADGKSTFTRTVEGLPTDYSDLEKLPEGMREIFVPLGDKAEEWATYSGPLEDAPGITVGGLAGFELFPDMDEPKEYELPKSGMQLKGSYSGKSITKSWTISPGGKNELLVLEKTPQEWIPDADTPEPLLIKVTGNGIDDEKVKIRFTLFEVTNEIGFCLNSLDKKEDFDLEFYPDATANYFNPPEETDDGWIIETDNKVFNASVGVFAVDWGAWGKLKAEYEIDKDVWYPIYCEDGKDYITIPLDERGGIENQIADQFEFDNFLPEGIPPKYDEERGGNPGDGLTAYEEYRGFMIGGDKGIHIRTSPKGMRDLFVLCDSPKLRSHLQNEMIVGNNIAIHLLDKYTDFVSSDQRVINPNRGDYSLGDQHGIWMFTAGLSPSGVLGRAYGDKISPGSTTSVILDLLEFREIIKMDEIRVTAIHELMHGCGVKHHGLTNASRVMEDYDGIEREVSIAYWDGVNAGDIRCVMQYGFGDYYFLKDGNVAYDEFGLLIKFENTESEILYNTLCTAKFGNSLHMESQLGRANMGECLKQVRIADN